MIEYLENLTANEEWQNALDYAEELLLTGNHSMKDMVAIHCAILASRVYLGDYIGAVVAGQTAVGLARHIEEWDYFGMCCVDLGVAYYYLRQWDQAIDSWLDFLATLHFYQRSAQYEARVRYNVGLIQTARGHYAAACRSMEQAVSAAERLGAQHHAYTIRLALIGSLLKAGQMQQIPRLLARCIRYLQWHWDAAEVRNSEMWLTKIRIDYTLATNRLIKARRMALQGLAASEARSDHQFAFHITLAQIALRRNCERDALAHFLAARSHAIHCHRQDLEAEAGESICKLTADGAEFGQMVDHYYLRDSSLLIAEDLDSRMSDEEE